MALEDLTPAVREEAILDGADIDPATRLEYFMKKAANEVPKPAGSSDAGKVVTVNEDGDGFELSDVDPGLPEIAGVSDAGKVVAVNAAGSGFELDTVPKELPSYTSSDIGKVLKVGSTNDNPAPAWDVEIEIISLTFDGATSELVASKTAGEMYDNQLLAVSIDSPVNYKSLIIGKSYGFSGYHFYAIADGSILDFVAATANDYPTATVS